MSHETDEATESGKEHQKRDKTKRVRVLNIKNLMYNVYVLQQFGAVVTNSNWVNRLRGRLAQLVERTLSMREVEGSKPSLSTLFTVDTEITRSCYSLSSSNMTTVNFVEFHSHIFFDENEHHHILKML